MIARSTHYTRCFSVLTREILYKIASGMTEIVCSLRRFFADYRWQSVLIRMPARPRSMFYVDENVIPFSTLPSGVIDETLNALAHVNLTHPGNTELTRYGDGRVILTNRSCPISSISDRLTDFGQHQKGSSNMCKHCKTLVSYHRMSDSVLMLLNNCSLIWKRLKGVEDSERLDWYRRNKKAGHIVKRSAASITH